MPNENRPLKVFLCHSSADKPAVRRLYRYLKQRGIQPWLDEVDLIPGQDWRAEIPNALYSSDVILVCLSKSSVDKEGYVQKEISFALDKALEKPEGTIFIIPTKLEECNVPPRLIHYQWVDLFRENGYKRLMQSLNLRAARLGPAIAQALVTDEVQEKESEKTDEPSISGPKLPVASPLNPLKSVVAEAMPFLMIATVIGIVALIVWIGSNLMSQFPPSLLSTATTHPSESIVGINLTPVSSTPPRTLLSPTLLSTPPLQYPVVAGATVQHLVVKGESLMLIARCYGANFAEVRHANPEIGDPGKLVPDKTVTIPKVGAVGNIYGPPCVASYTVKSGDTLESIAQKYNADFAVLQSMNADGLSPGSVLLIPLNSAGGAPALIPLPPTPLNIPAGSDSATEKGSLNPLAVARYVFTANQGQTMSIKVTSPSDSAQMTIYREGGANSVGIASFEWRGRIEQSGDHIIEISSSSDSLAIDYSLEVVFTTASPAASATSAP